MELKGKVAFITGAAQGIGKAIAMILAEAGADIVVADLDLVRAQETAKEISEGNSRALALKINVSSFEEVREAVNSVMTQWGRLDILVNNAGITRDSLLIRMKEEDWDLVMEVNLNGTFHCTKAVLPLMAKRREGKIVSIASIVGFVGNAGQANYAASKAAVIGFTKTVAREYASRGINVNAVAPGFIETAMTHGLSQEVRESLQKQIPLGRLGTAQDVAHAVRFLVSKEATYITGQVIHVNGGMLMS